MIDFNEMRSLQEDAVKYRNMKGRYLEYAKSLEEIKKQLEKVIAELNPVSAVVKESRNIPKQFYTEALADIYLSLRNGNSVTPSFLGTTYPSLNRWHLWRKVLELKGVETRQLKGRGKEAYIARGG